MKPTDFSIHVTNFLTHYLAAQRKSQPQYHQSVSDVFYLLLRFCVTARHRPGKAASRTDRCFIGGSIPGSLGDERKSSPRTRNHRLALCTHSSDMFRRRAGHMVQCRKSRDSPTAATLATVDTFPKTNWLRSGTAGSEKLEGRRILSCQCPLRHRSACPGVD